MKRLSDHAAKPGIVPGHAPSPHPPRAWSGDAKGMKVENGHGPAAIGRAAFAGQGRARGIEAGRTHRPPRP
jgi:hypothetical protein